jgi:hypothetical protein
MALGGFVFRALGFSFDAQGRGLETPWSEIEVAGRFDTLQWTGPKAETFSIKGVIFDPEFGGQESLDGIRQSAMAGQPLMLVTRAGRVMGLHVVLSVKEDRSYIRASGQASLNRYDIELKRYHGPSGLGLAGAVAGALGRLF